MNAETRPPARDTLITGKQQENDRMTAHFLDYIKNDVHTHYLKSDSLQNIFFKNTITLNQEDSAQTNGDLQRLDGQSHNEQMSLSIVTTCHTLTNNYLPD